MALVLTALNSAHVKGVKLATFQQKQTGNYFQYNLLFLNNFNHQVLKKKTPLFDYNVIVLCLYLHRGVLRYSKMSIFQ